MVEISLCKELEDDNLVGPMDVVEEPQTPDPPAKELLKWKVLTVVQKYYGDYNDSGDIPEDVLPYETVEIEGNSLVNNGASIICDALIGTAITAFSNANARIGIGDSATATTNTNTDLLASTNKLRKAMDATYPQKSGAAPWSITFRSTFSTADAVYTWAEWAIFNAASGATSMLNRKAEAMGTKGAGVTWVISVTITPTAP